MLLQSVAILIIKIKSRRKETMKKKILALTTGLAMVLGAGSAIAGVDSGTADYSLSLVDACIVDTSAASTAFPDMPTGSTAVTGVAAGSISVSCANGLAYAVGANGGNNWDGGTSTFGLLSAGWQRIPYVINEGGVPFGDIGLTANDPTYTEQTTMSARTGTGTGAPIVYNLTADLDVQNWMVAGDHFDTVTYSVTWP